MSVFRGQAAFTWTDSDDTLTQRVLLLCEPLREIRPAHDQAVYESQSLDRTARQIFTVGEGADDLVVRARFVDDPQGLMDFIKAGTKKRTVSYVPDLRDPAVKYDCELIAPLSPTALGLDPDRGVTFGEQDVELRLRQTNQDPFPGVHHNPTLFSLRAGGRIEEGTFSRAGTASYAANSDALGTLTTGASGAARLHWMSSASSVGPRRIPTLLLEEQRTNLIKQSENFASTSWTKTNVTVTTGQTDPRGGTNAQRLTDTNALAIGTVTQVITVTTSTRGVLSGWLRPSTAPVTTKLYFASTNFVTPYVRLTVTWSSGKPSVATVTGEGAMASRWRGGWFRISARTTGNLTTGNYGIAVEPSGVSTGSVYAFGFQPEVV